MENPDQLTYKIALSLIPGIGNVTARNLIAYIGSVEGVFHEKEKTLLKIPGVGEINAQRVITQNVLERAKREVDFIQRNRIQTFFYLDENYPTRLKNCSDAPIILYFRGKANLNEQRIIAVVGTRNATTYGKEMCDELIENFSKQNLNLILKDFSSSQNITFSKFMKNLRTMLSGLKEGPGVAEMMEILGRESTLERIERLKKKNK